MDERTFVLKLAEVLKVDGAHIDDQFPLDPKGWDSLELLSIIALLDTHLGVTLETVELKTCRSVGALLESARRRKLQT